MKGYQSCYIWWNSLLSLRFVRGSEIKRAAACLMALPLPNLLYVYPALERCKEADSVFLGRSDDMNWF